MIGTSTKKYRNPNRNDGLVIIEGDLVDLDTADILTCPVLEFESRMAQRYPDWNAFKNWMEQHERSN